jgi:hypothetical protein
MIFLLNPCVAGRAYGREGTKSYNGEKAWFSLNHSILSGLLERGRRIRFGSKRADQGILGQVRVRETFSGNESANLEV